ncbi:MaoC family dehydratase [Mycolicibacterium sp. BiH015]|uniref:MaoC family dehydratase n=1 Tax=Mycolicibacterium sp. BiH015 TaxID=3018808 RepID=UPI0022E23DE1|nr:MaoC family dehydratase [Mycolicibacterium sp. BiH015]MDA2893448.1 MaoC family dehydratase [Mycolicibacterium sp. BiH015]
MPRLSSAYGGIEVRKGSVTSPLWLDDIQVGNQFTSDVYELTADSIIEFASEWDPQPFHLGEESARDTFFGGLAASGWHTAAITMRLLVTSGFPVANGLIGASIELAYPTPTRPGDKLRVHLEVKDVTRSKSRPGRGYITAAYETVNQHGEVRQRTMARLLSFARPS